MNLKKRYPFKCECGHEIEAGPSLFMVTFQMNNGHINCPKCKKSTHVCIDKNNERMIKCEPREISQLPPACYRLATPEEEERLKRLQEQTKS